MKNTVKDWYRIDNVDELDSPSLVIYPARVKKNIETAITMVADANRLRPHMKTNKSAEVARLMIGAGISKFKCATIAEAEMLAMEGAGDILLAYQPVGPKLARLIHLIKKYPNTKFSCLTDNLSAAKEMDQIFAAAKMKLPVFLDLNVGQNRTGIIPGEHARDLYFACADMKALIPIGLHAYDGHIRDQDWEKRKLNCDKAFEAVQAMRIEILKKGLPDPILVVGGSPTFSIHCRRENVECSPGTFVYWDKGYLDLCPEQNFLPAALVVTRVISVVNPSTFCLDLGHKSVAAENELNKRVYFLNASGIQPTGQSEEHLVVKAEGESLKIGNVLYGLPFHICPTVALYERAATVNEQKYNGEWRVIARDRKITQ
ncbi:MAG TPA: D-TA family PLP-dependent enzyme [Puia sp.]|nr:D-TA family PLP-dependent enzyme [Puia sp.]